MYADYKTLRNKVRKLELTDALYVVWAFSQYLQIRGFEIPSDIEVAHAFRFAPLPQTLIGEWELELLAKEIIINAHRSPGVGTTLRKWDNLGSIVNELKRLENNIYRQYGSSKNIWNEMLRIAHRQFIWQESRPNSATATRYYKIFKDPTLDQICIDRLGLGVRQIYRYGMALFGVFRERPVVDDSYLEKLRSLLKSDNVSEFLQFTCRTESDLRKSLETEQRYDAAYAYAYHSLKAYPLVQATAGSKYLIFAPVPTLLFWRITSGLYYELLSDSRFSQAFGSSFQNYVGQVAQTVFTNPAFTVFSESEYGLKRSRKNSADWIILEDGAALFIECKAKRLSWKAKVDLDAGDDLENDIDHLANAVVQLYKTISDYLANQYSHLPYEAERRIYPIVVTLENWHLFGSRLFESLASKVDIRLGEAGLDRNLAAQMPYLVAAVSDMEMALPIIHQSGISYFMEGKLSDAEMKTWNLHSYVTAKFGDQISRKNLFPTDFREIFSGSGF